MKFWFFVIMNWFFFQKYLQILISLLFSHDSHCLNFAILLCDSLLRNFVYDIQ